MLSLPHGVTNRDKHVLTSICICPACRQKPPQLTSGKNHMAAILWVNLVLIEMLIMTQWTKKSVVYVRGLNLKDILFHASRFSSVVPLLGLEIFLNATLTVKVCVTLKHLHLEKFYFHRCLYISNKLQAEIFSRGWRIVEQMQQNVFRLMHLQNVNSFCWLTKFSCRIPPLSVVFIYFLIVN